MKIYLNSYPVLKTRLWVGENNEGHWGEKKSDGA
jgi:hypothetical protein